MLILFPYTFRLLSAFFYLNSMGNIEVQSRTGVVGYLQRHTNQFLHFAPSSTSPIIYLSLLLEYLNNLQGCFIENRQLREIQVAIRGHVVAQERHGQCGAQCQDLEPVPAESQLLSFASSSLSISVGEHPDGFRKLQIPGFTLTQPWNLWSAGELPRG